MRHKNTYDEAPSLKKRLLITFVVWLPAAAVFFAVAVGIITYVSTKNILISLKTPTTYYIFGGAMLALVLYTVFDYRVRASKRVIKVNKDLENSHFMTKSEINHADGFTVTNLEGLSKVDDGVVLACDLNKNKTDMKIVLRKPIHTLVIASTGTGKTQTFVSPSIEVLSRTKTQPSMVVTDPKGELYCKHAAGLRARGYDVLCIDLTDIYHSSRWNPFNDVLKKTELLKSDVTIRAGKYYYDGQRYLTFAEADQAAHERRRAIEDDIYIDLQDIIYTACPVDSSSHEKFWQDGARNFIFGLTLAFWEDVRDGYMRPEQLNLYNIWRTISDYCKGDMAELKAYFKTRDEISKVIGLVSTVLVAEDVTLSSFLSNVNQLILWLADGGITALTAANDIEFSELDERPSVLFIRIPDERENRHVLVSIMIVQAYKALVQKARDNKKTGDKSDEELKRHVYFIMDEFGNLPKLNKIDSIITVGRSRGIFMMPVIQDYAQLDNKYGKEIAQTVRSNTNIKIFMGSTDKNTIEEFSALCGKKKSRQLSYSENKDMSVSTSAQSVPLIYPSELAMLNDPNNKIIGNSVILVDGAPLKTHSSPFFESKKLFLANDCDIKPAPFIEFDEKDVRYNILDIVGFLQINEEINVSEVADEDAEEPEAEENVASQLAESAAKAAERYKHKYLGKLAAFRGRIPKSVYDALATAEDANYILSEIDLRISAAKKAKDARLAGDLIQFKNFVLYQDPVLDAGHRTNKIAL